MTSLAFDPAAPNEVLTGNQSGRQFRSKDRGESWEEEGDEPSSLNALLIDRSSETWAATNGGPFRRSGAGVWVKDTAGLEGAKQRVWRLALGVDGVVFIGTSDGLLWRDFMGWRDAGLSGQMITALSVGPEPNGEGEAIYAGTRSGLYFGTGRGAKWAPASELPRRWILAVSALPTEPQIVYAGIEGRGLYKTLVGGR